MSTWWWNWPETKHKQKWEAWVSFFKLMGHKRKSRWSRSNEYKWDWKLFRKSKTWHLKKKKKKKLHFFSRFKNHFNAVFKVLVKMKSSQGNLSHFIGRSGSSADNSWRAGISAFSHSGLLRASEKLISSQADRNHPREAVVRSWCSVVPDRQQGLASVDFTSLWD